MLSVHPACRLKEAAEASQGRNIDQPLPLNQDAAAYAFSANMDVDAVADCCLQAMVLLDQTHG